MQPQSKTLVIRLSYVARIAIAALVGVTGVILLLATFEPMVAGFPRASGARELIFAIALLWGVVIGGFTAVVTLGSAESTEPLQLRRRAPEAGAADPV